MAEEFDIDAGGEIEAPPPPKNKGGRPTIELTPEQVALVGKLSALLSMEQIADILEISERTFSRICERQPEVMSAYKRGRAAAIAKVAGGLLQEALGGDPASRFFYLKTQGGWRETTKVEHGGSVTVVFNGDDANL